jgi:hypothetical protein
MNPAPPATKERLTRRRVSHDRVVRVRRHPSLPVPGGEHVPVGSAGTTTVRGSTPARADTALRRDSALGCLGVVSLNALLYDRDPVPPGRTGANGLRDRERRRVLQRHRAAVSGRDCRVCRRIYDESRDWPKRVIDLCQGWGE